MKDFKEALAQLPDQPGVYLMYDQEGTIIYVGKAISLKNRVRSYFQKSPHGKTAKVRAMVEHVDHFEYILVENEVEALVLESNFIKEHAPKYNILLRDDKQYPYICIKREKYPRLLKVRQAANDGSAYFGPYPNAYAVNDMIALLQRLYRLRTCNLDFDKSVKLRRPCLNYYIDQCPAPCVGLADETVYMQGIAAIEQVLKGKDQALREQLEGAMKEAAKELKFEKAARIRDDLRQLDALMEKQQVTFTQGKDADIIAMARGSNEVCVQIFFLRGGKLIDREHFSMQEEYHESRAAILSSFMKQFYTQAQFVPKEILVEVPVEDQETIAAFLSEKKGQVVEIHVPQRGDKNALMQKVRRNAEEQLAILQRRAAKKERNTNRGIAKLEEMIGHPVERVEAYDISHTAGVQTVGSMVVYYKETKQPKEYRKFKIRTVDGNDEYASQREMLQRRFDHGLRDQEKNRRGGFAEFPSLILMDGGRGQVHLAEKILEDRGLHIPVMGMVKDDHHQTRALWYQNREWPLAVRDPLYKYLYAVQEEVHRFAIGYHRQLRSQQMVASELDGIPGIGPARRRALQKAMTKEQLRSASVEELRAIPGMTQAAAENVYAYFEKQRMSSMDGKK